MSILPTGGSMRRSGMISGLVSRRIASANGLRKFGAHHLHDEPQDEHAEIQRE